MPEWTIVNGTKIERHVEEEEGEMFVLLTQWMPIDQQEKLGRRVRERKADLKVKLAA